MNESRIFGDSGPAEWTWGPILFALSSYEAVVKVVEVIEGQ